MPQTALIDSYNELLQNLQRKQLSEAKALFFKKPKKRKYYSSLNRQDQLRPALEIRFEAAMVLGRVLLTHVGIPLSNR